MPLVIDASSPAFHSASTQTNTTAAFTPPDSPLLLALWVGNSEASTDPSTPTAASTPSQTWTREEWDHRSSGTPTQDGQTAIWDAQVTGSPGSTTVTITSGAGSFGWSSALSLMVMTGQDTVAPIGLTGSGRAAGPTTVIATFTASITGGQSFMVVSDWNAASTAGWAAATDCTLLAKGTVGTDFSYAIVQRTDPDEVVGVSTSVGITGLTSLASIVHYSWVEVISLEAGLAARNVVGQGPPVTALHHAANW